MISAQVTMSNSYKIPEGLRLNGLVARPEIAFAVQADDLAGLHVHDRRAGISAERRAVVIDGILSLADHLARGEPLHLQLAAEDGVDKQWILFSVERRIAKHHHLI